MGEMKRLWEDKILRKSNQHNFYEVKDSEGRGIWGGKSTVEAVKFYRSSKNATVWVGVWIEEDDDALLLIEPINITNIILATISDTMDRSGL